MNGHSSAETLAFSIMEIARRCAQALGDSDEAPIFLFAAGCHSGETNLKQLLPCAMAHELATDPALLASLAWQLVRIGSAACADPSSHGAQVAAERTTDWQALRAVADAQRCFLRGLCKQQDKDETRWGLVFTAVTADCALYLKLLFPRARFIFLHRNPTDTFRQCLQAMRSGSLQTPRDLRLAAAFAEQWCRLVASFELWHKEVGGIVTGYDRAVAAAPREIEEYLGERLSPLAPRDEAASAEGELPALQADEAKVLIESTAHLAARCGYDMGKAGSLDSAQDETEPASAALRPGVHLQGRQVNCAILVPAMRYIEPECDEALLELERRGYAVRRRRGSTSIDHARSVLATAALDQGFEETLWVDADTAFDPDAVERIRSHGAPIVAGICARKGARAGLAVAPVPGTRELVMGEGGGLVEVLYAGTGFLLVRKEVYVAIQRRFNLPLCDASTIRRAIPFFMPMLEDWGGQLTYLGEDYAFSRRARLCGYKIMADTTIRLWHIGMYRYGYEDAGNEVPRVETYKHLLSTEQSQGG